MHIEFLIMPIIAFLVGILIGFLIKYPNDTYNYHYEYKKVDEKIAKWKWEIKAMILLLLVSIVGLVTVICFKNQEKLKELHILLLTVFYSLIFIISIMLLRVSVLIANY